MTAQLRQRQAGGVPAISAYALTGIASSSSPQQGLTPAARQALLDSLPLPLAKAVRSTLDFKPIITRSQLAALIASTPQTPTKGGVFILLNRLILNPSEFLPSHPGGELALLHFVGRDAQDEIEAYHSDVALRQMASWVVGILDEKDWLNQPASKEGSSPELLERGAYVPLVPPIQLGYRAGVLEAPHAQAAAHTHHSDKVTLKARPRTFPLPPEMLEPPPPPSTDIEPERERKMSQAYRKLHRRIAQDGWYRLRPAGYARECTRYALLGATALYLYFQGIGASSESDRHTQSPVLLFLSSVFLGLFWHQLTFSAHDAGHHGITHSPLVDRLIGVTIADLIGGLSIGWWCDNHDVHHLVTNHPEHDPDIQHMPFFAISGRFVEPEPVPSSDGNAAQQDATAKARVTLAPEGLWSSYYRRVLTFDAPARVFLKYQHQLYYVVMSLGRFNLYANSYGFLAKRALRLLFPGRHGGALGGDAIHDAFNPATATDTDVVIEGLPSDDAKVVQKLLHPRHQSTSAASRRKALTTRDRTKIFHLLVEISCLVVFWTWFGWGMLGSIRGWGWRVMYVLVSHIVTSPLHVQIVLSHFAQSSVDLGLFESFPSRQLRTTMDVLCPPSLDFLHGGLHMQVSHHLFPRIPRHNLRPVRDRYVRPFADEWAKSHPRTVNAAASGSGAGSGAKASLYEEYTFGAGNRKVLGVLEEVARQVRVLSQVAEAQARGTLHHHNQQGTGVDTSKVSKTTSMLHAADDGDESSAGSGNGSGTES
ncbi:hypothetical protein OC861_004860 [Tilletia horrida]|nr:hypothetical protein OC845_005614 [Tilletia horrida]KAK0563313.1 hypothetical protein OC861_004860 [Tilletia horrida]